MITFLDAGSGVAGDMLLSALIGLGVPPEELSRILRRAIPLKGWHLAIQPVEKAMWPAWSLHVRGDRPVPSKQRMQEIISQADLPGLVKKRSLAILRTLIVAEKRAHGHAHSDFDPKGLGRIDTLVDVIGNAWALWRLGIPHLICSPINTGRIAPATSAILMQYRVPAYADTSMLELATPTGTAILSATVKQFRTMPVMRIIRAGYGAGSQTRKGKPNVLAIYQGRLIRRGRV